MSLSDCLRRLKIPSEDAAEIRDYVDKANGDEHKGVQRYLDDLHDDLEDMRSQLKDKGFDLSPKVYQPEAKTRKKSPAVVEAETAAEKAKSDAEAKSKEADAKVKAAEDRAAQDAKRAKDEAAAKFSKASAAATDAFRKSLDMPPEPKTEKIVTADGTREQYVMPGTEQSAKQAAQAREDRGHGKIVPKAAQKDADHGMFAPADKPQGPGLFEKAKGENVDRTFEARLTAKEDAEDSALIKTVEKMNYDAMTPEEQAFHRAKGKKASEYTPEEKTAMDNEIARRRAREDKAYHDKNFEAVREHEPGLTREAYDKRAAAGKAFALGMLGARDNPAPATKSGLKAARDVVDHEATPDQKAAGNYQKGHVKWNGLDVSIETGKGHERTSHEVGPDGKPKWSVEMPVDYGYIKRSEGADGEGVDVFIGDHPESDKVWIIDQQHIPSKEFDEHKVMLGFKSAIHAIKAYRDSFSDGKGAQRIRSITLKTVKEFKDILGTLWQKKPVYTGKPSERGGINIFGGGKPERYSRTKDNKKTPEGEKVWKGPANKRPGTLLGNDFSVPDKGVVDVLKENTIPFFERLGSLTADNWRETARHMWDRLGDKMTYQHAYEKAIIGADGKQLPLEQRAYLREELRAGRTGEKLEALRHDMFDPLIEDIIGARLSYPVIERYLHALHAGEREKQIQKINPKYKEEGGGSGWQTEDWGTPQAFIHGLANSGHLPALQKIAKRVRSILDFQLKERVDSGLLSAEDAKRLRDTYQNYVPLRGMDEIGAPHSGTGAGISVKGGEFKRALGRSSAPKDILANVIMMAQEAIIRGEKNRVGNALQALVKEHPDKAIWELDPVEHAPTLNKTTGLVETRPVSALSAAEAEKTVVTKIAGKEHRVVLHDIRLARAWKNLDMRSGNIIFDVLGAFNRYLSTANTGLNPEFVITNAMRDYQEAMINIQQFDHKGLAKDVTKDYLRAVRGAWGGLDRKATTQWQKYFREFAASGGKVSFWRADDVERMRTTFVKELNRKGKGFAPWTKQALRSVGTIIEHANSAVENGVRLSFFVNLRKRGVEVNHAASLARNLTIDFNKHGSWGPMLNAMYLFYNASLQGTAVMARALRSPKVQKIAGAILLTGVAMDMMNSMLSSDTDKDGKSDYDKLDEYTKSRHLLIMNPNGGTAFKISTPYGYGTFYNTGRLISAYARGGQKGAEALKNMFVETANAFNPVGGSESLLNLIAPTFLDPAVDLTRNRDFADRQIVKEVYPGEDWIPNSQRYFSNTPGYMKWASEHLNAMFGGDKYTSSGPITDVSPDVFEYLIGQFTGGAGQFVARVANLPEKIANGTATLNDIPFVRRFTQEPPTYRTKAIGYTAMREVDDAAARYKKMLNDGDDAAADKYYSENEGIIGLHAIANTTRKRLSQIRKDREEIEGLKTPMFRRRRLLIENEKEQLEAMTDFTRDYYAAIGEKNAGSLRDTIGKKSREEVRSWFGDPRRVPSPP